jgi:hypothetical protein
MSLKDDRAEFARTLTEQDRIEKRNAKIQEMLSAERPETAEGQAGAAPEPSVRRPQTDSEATAESQERRTYYGRPLRDWESLDAKGRPFQHRPLTLREREALDEEVFMESQRRQDEAHAAKVAEAEKEAKAEEKAIAKRAEYEKRTGKRSMQTGLISLERARELGYLQSGNSTSSNGRPEWYSENNPTGQMCGG